MLDSHHTCLRNFQNLYARMFSVNDLSPLRILQTFPSGTLALNCDEIFGSLIGQSILPKI